MGDFFTSFIQLVFSKEIKVLSKTLTFIAIIISLLLIDNVLGFTYYHNIKNKVEQLKNIQEILKDSTLDSDSKTFLIETKEHLIHRKNFFNNILSNSSSILASQQNKLYHLIASTWYWLILLFIMPFIMWKDKNLKNLSFPLKISYTIFTELIIALLCFGWSSLTYAIPDIFGLRVFNYTLLALLQLLFAIYSLKEIKKDKELERSNT
jgi:hypothetical protein